MNLNSHTHSQRGRWERGRSPVGGDCYHTILNPIFKIKPWLFFMPNIGAMAYPKGISVGHRPYRFFRLHHFKLSTFYFDGVVRGLHPTRLSFMPILFRGALENSTLRNFLNYQKYDNLTNFLLKLFFNVKIIKSDRILKCQI